MSERADLQGQQGLPGCEDSLGRTPQGGTSLTRAIAVGQTPSKNPVKPQCLPKPPYNLHSPSEGEKLTLAEPT